MLLWLIGTAGASALLDFCCYGNSISSPEILSLPSPKATEVHNALVQLAIFAVPGYFVAIALLDRTGRKRIQVLGFAVWRSVPSHRDHRERDRARLAVPDLVRGQLLLHRVRRRHDDVRVSGRDLPGRGPDYRPRHIGRAGKLGAFLGAFLFPDFLASSLGIRGAEVIAGCVPVVGVALTIAFLPEPKGKCLEELSAEATPARVSLEPA